MMAVGNLIDSEHHEAAGQVFKQAKEEFERIQDFLDDVEDSKEEKDEQVPVTDNKKPESPQKGPEDTEKAGPAGPAQTVVASKPTVKTATVNTAAKLTAGAAVQKPTSEVPKTDTKPTSGGTQGGLI